MFHPDPLPPDEPLADNPLLIAGNPPPFARVRAEHVGPALSVCIDEAERVQEEVLSLPGQPGWDELVGPLDEAEGRLELVWVPVDHLARVLKDDPMRAAHREGTPRFVAHQMRVSQDPRLFAALKRLSARGADSLSPARQKVLTDWLRELEVAGVGLPQAERDRCAEIHVSLARLGSRFAENLTDATDAWRLPLSAEQVAPLPARIRQALRARALADDPAAPEGAHAVSAHQHEFTPFLRALPDAALRERAYLGWSTLASAGATDNAPLILETLALRAELAGRLGHRSYAAMTLRSEMAGTPAEVRGFLLDLAQRVRPLAERELELLTQRAGRDGLSKLIRSDIGYYRERLLEERLALRDEELSVWFPLSGVLSGASEIVRRLFGLELSVRSAEGRDYAWDPHVQALELREPDGTLLATILLDPYARPGKRSGAWVSGIVPGLVRPDGEKAPSLVVLCASFPPPAGGRPSMLTHDHVRTLMHELGHALHNALSEVRERRGFGTRGVPRDGVELPSKLMEQWVWRPEALRILSGHVETGEPMPDALLERMRQARDLTRGLDVLRQVELSLFDLELHDREAPGSTAEVRALFERVRETVALVPEPPGERAENLYHHLFSSGYASRYYSYLWSDSLACDVFSRFEEEGIWSRSAGEDLRRRLLAHGGAADMMELFVAFRGRRPSPLPFLRQMGCDATPPARA